MNIKKATDTTYNINSVVTIFLIKYIYILYFFVSYIIYVC
uniref:Uncharacterized protein n=1 Tax=viral metagenome TaxID=1070528 RepID=A0A6C0E372_9ZZZZ